MHVTREDLEKTRLGKIINELRRKTTDKELAKLSKKLIKTWQSLMVSNGHRNGPTAPPAAGHSQPHSSEEQNSPAETHDEDSNSSVFSNLSVDGIALANSRSLLGSPSASALLNNSSATKNPQHHNHHNHNSSRKRKLERETDTLRENLNSIMISGSRRLQTTQELAQKYNIQIKPSLSASSSPHLQVNNKNDSLSPAKRPKVNGTSYHAKTNGFHHHDENSQHELDSVLPVVKNNRYHNKSLPASPALQSLRNNTSHSANTSPALLSSQSHLFENDVVTRPNLKVKIGKNGKLSRQTSPAIATESTSAGHLVNGNAIKSEAIKSEPESTTTTTEITKPAKRRGTAERTVSDVDRDIREIYAQMPQINPEDLEWVKQFKFDTDEPNEPNEADEADEPEEPKEELQLENELNGGLKDEEKQNIVDRIADDQWENMNGNYDKDGVWHHFGEMTSAFVLTGGKNAANKEEENVLHILPYVNYTW